MPHRNRNIHRQIRFSIYQDFHASVFFKNLVALMADPVQSEITAFSRKERHEHQINFTYAMGKVKHLWCYYFKEQAP
jgi:hypothetical protein